MLDYAFILYTTLLNEIERGHALNGFGSRRSFQSVTIASSVCKMKRTYSDMNSSSDSDDNVPVTFQVAH